MGSGRAVPRAEVCIAARLGAQAAGERLHQQHAALRLLPRRRRQQLARRRRRGTVALLGSTTARLRCCVPGSVRLWWRGRGTIRSLLPERHSMSAKGIRQTGSVRQDTLGFWTKWGLSSVVLNHSKAARDPGRKRAVRPSVGTPSAAAKHMGSQNRQKLKPGAWLLCLMTRAAGYSRGAALSRTVHTAEPGCGGEGAASGPRSIRSAATRRE